MSATLALVLGRFLPVHNGHLFLMETALHEHGALLVVVRSTRRDPIPAAVRVRWLRGLLRGAVRVEQIEDERRLDPRDPETVAGWARRVEALLPPDWARLPRCLVAGEPHVAPLAEALGARSQIIDRSILPVSGTLIRADPLAHAHFLPPVVQQFLLPGEKLGLLGVALRLGCWPCKATSSSPRSAGPRSPWTGSAATILHPTSPTRRRPRRRPRRPRRRPRFRPGCGAWRPAWI